MPRARDPRSKLVVLSFVLTSAVLIALGLSSRTAFDYAGPPILLLFIAFAAIQMVRIFRRTALLRRARFEFIRRLPAARQPAAIARVLTKPLHYDRDDTRKAISIFLAEHGQFGVAYRLYRSPPTAVPQDAESFEPVEIVDLAAHWLSSHDGASADPASRSIENLRARRALARWGAYAAATTVLVVLPAMKLVDGARVGFANLQLQHILITAWCLGIWIVLTLALAMRSESWHVIPTGLVRRRLNRITGRVRLRSFRRNLSTLVATQLSDRRWIVRVSNGAVAGAFSVSTLEATAILRAWRNHASSPTLDRIRQALG